MKRRLSIGAVVAVAALSACASGETDPATDVTATTATLNAHGDAKDRPRRWWFEYGRTTSYGTRTPGGTVPADFTGPVAEEIRGLSPSTLYHFRACASATDGSDSGCAGDQTLTTRSPGFDSRLRRYPYLTDLVGTSATVNWATNTSSSSGTLRWGRVSGGSCTTNSVTATRTSITVNGVAEYQWKARISGLAPDTQYCYRVYLGSPQTDLLRGDASPRFRSQLATGASTPFSFVVFGDWGLADEDGNPDQANLMQEIAASGARFAVTTGDNAYNSGTQTNYGDLQQTGDHVSGVFGPDFWKLPGASMPIFPAIGNHGFSSSTPHRDNWPQDVAVSSSGGSYAAGPARYWYAFDAGNTRFYVLEAAWSDTATDYRDDYNAHWSQSSDEYEWLEQDLEDHPAQLKFAFFHYPLYSDQRGEPSDEFLQGSDSLEGLLARNGVDIAFNGHAHIYQRNRDPGAGGLVSYVTGAGGADTASIGESGCSSIDAYGIGWSDTDNRGNRCGAAPVPSSRAQVFHFIEVSVNGAQVTVTPTNSLGNTFDIQTYNFSP